MRAKGDSSGFDELERMLEDARFAALSKVGREACRNAKLHKGYENRTGNLANANGGCVVRGGRIVDLWVETDGSHLEAARNTEGLLRQASSMGDGLYLANGMEYASYVESKGFDVISSGGLLHARELIDKL